MNKLVTCVSVAVLGVLVWYYFDLIGALVGLPPPAWLGVAGLEGPGSRVFSYAPSTAPTAQVELRGDWQAVLVDGGRVEVLAEGLEWAEGVTWTAHDGGDLFFSDVVDNKLWRWTAAGRLELVRGRSGQTFDNGVSPREPGSNGLLYSPLLDTLFSCEHGRRRVSVTVRIHSSWPNWLSCTSYGPSLSHRYNSPNDLALAHNHLYFTDPPYGLRQTAHDSPEALDTHPSRQVPYNGVYRLPLNHVFGVSCGEPVTEININKREEKKY